MKFVLEWQDRSGRVEVMGCFDLGTAMFWSKILLKSGAQYAVIR